MKSSILITALVAFNWSFTYADENTLSLERVLEIAESKHPELGMGQTQVSEAEARQTGAPSLPPPTLFVGSMGSNGPLNSDGRMENSIGVTQTIPFPTKLTSESNVRSYQADSSKAELQATRLDVRAEAKAAFYDLYGARKKLALLEEKASVFKEHSDRVRAATVSDRFMQAHRLWVQTELDLVQNEILSAKEEERISSGRLNVAMGTSPDSPIPSLEEPPPSSAPSTTFTENSHPSIRSLELSKSAAESEVSQAKSLWLPDFTLTYRNARRFDGVMPNYSELTLGVTLPFLFFWENKGTVGAANAKAQKAEYQLVKTRNDLKMKFIEAQTRAESLKAQLSNYEDRILPQARKRMKIAHGLVPSDMESLNEHRDAMESVIKLSLSALELRIQYEKAVANLESLLSSSPSVKEAR